MGLPLQKQQVSVAVYLQGERDSLEKHEYCAGNVLSMAGGSAAHSLITANIIAGLGSRLAGKPCRVYDSNLRIRIPKRLFYTYPDLSIICGPLQLDADDRGDGTATNPRVIVEVLSPSTEAHDRGEKFRMYQELKSLEEYILVWQHEPRVEVFRRRDGDEWLLTTASGREASVRLRSVKISLPLAEIYAGVAMPPPGA